MILQVTGLPRSGTGFMAAFLNLHPDCFAHHDAAADRDDWREHSERLAGTWKFVAEVSTYGWIPKATRTTGAKVYIDRDPAEVVQSVNDIMDKAQDVKRYRDMRASALFWADEHKALVVPYEHLFTIEILHRIWDHLFGPGYLFPMEKAGIFIRMNIQRQHPEQMLGDAETAYRRLFQ